MVNKPSLMATKIVALSAVMLAILTTLTGCSGIERRSEAPKKQELPEIAATQVHAKLGWSQKVGTGVGKADVKLQLAGTENIIVASDAKGRVMAMERATGKQLWQITLKAPLSAGPAVADGKVFLGSSQAEVIALNLTDGAELWRAPATSEILAAPVAQDGMVFVHTLDGGLAALEASNGKQLWKFSLNIPPLMLRHSSTPVVTSDYVISGFASGKVVAINRIDGSVDWAQDVSLPKGRSDIQRMVDVSAMPIVSQDMVYAVAYQGNLAAFALKSGQPIWSREISSYVGMALAKDVLYVVATDGEILAIDKFTGNTLWQQPQLKGRRLSRPVIQKIQATYVVVGDVDGYLHWLNAEQGQIVGRLKVADQSIEAEPMVYPEALYVYSKNGKVSQVFVE